MFFCCGGLHETASVHLTTGKAGWSRPGAGSHTALPIPVLLQVHEPGPMGLLDGAALGAG